MSLNWLNLKKVCVCSKKKRTILTETDEEEEYDYGGDDPQAQAFKDGGVNKQLVVSKDRSYVENQGRIGVFRNSEDTGELQYIATINKLVAPKGKIFVPKKVSNVFFCGR